MKLGLHLSYLLFVWIIVVLQLLILIKKTSVYNIWTTVNIINQQNVESVIPSSDLNSNLSNSTIQVNLPEKIVPATPIPFEDPHELVFRKRPETKHIDCKRILDKDKEYIDYILEDRPAFEESDLSMDCDSIQMRVLPPVPLKNTSFGVAFARIVNKDYEFVEDEVRAMYHPENIFCFVLDIKSEKYFKLQMKNLSNCIPNVFLTEKNFDIDSDGHNMNLAHLQCLKELNHLPNWEYVILLQNYDIFLRTRYELVAALKEMGGANDINSWQKAPESRLNKTFKWDAKSLKLFRHEELATKFQLNAKLKISKGAVQASLSRAAVEWLVETVDLSLLIKQFESGDFGVDEQLFPTLHVTDDLRMPGRFTSKCYDEGKQINYATRITHWYFDNSTNCPTKSVRHSTCTLGLEDLPILAEYPHFVANKFLPYVDYAGIDCLHELLFNRTFLGQHSPFNVSLYANLQTVQYHKAKKTGRAVNIQCGKSEIWKPVERV